MKKFVWFLSALLMMASAMGTPAHQKGAKAATKDAASQAAKEITPDDVPRISVDELILMMAKKKTTIVVIDTRVLDSYNEKIRGALQIPYDQVEAHLKDIPRNKEIILYCA